MTAKQPWSVTLHLKISTSNSEALVVARKRVAWLEERSCLEWSSSSLGVLFTCEATMECEVGRQMVAAPLTPHSYSRLWS